MVEQIPYSIVTVAIGPVQRYISQARRTHDLWLGSQLLSHLAKQGVIEAAENHGATMIYPVPTEDGTWASIPNRFMFFVEGDGEAVAEAVERAIQDKWLDIADRTKGYIQKHVPDGNNPAWDGIWNDQVKNWLEVYWVTVPCLDISDPELYPEAIALSGKAMASRKMARHFPQISEEGLKDTLTGEHEVLRGSSTSLGDVRRYWASIRGKIRNPALLRSGEYLGAISLIKRFAHKVVKDLQHNSRFPSTSSIASITFRLDVLEALYEYDESNPDEGQAVKELYQSIVDHINALKRLNIGIPQAIEAFPFLEARYADYVEAFGEDETIHAFLAVDGDFFYLDTLESKTLAEYLGQEPSDENVRVAQNTLRGLLESASQLDIAHPHSYLAVLAADGDRMGQRVGECQTLEAHQDFSRALAAYASEHVGAIVEHDLPGKLIYSGGDDVMALVPVRHVLAMAEALRVEFTSVMEKGEFPGMTASTGIAIVHHTHPLSQAIQAARQAEHNAKHPRGEHPDRDGLSVSLLRRSGEQQSVYLPWGYTHTAPAKQPKDLPVVPIEIVAEMQDRFTQRRYSRNLPYDVKDMAYRMDGGEVLPETKKAELSRVLKRRVPQKLSQAEKNPMVNQDTEWLSFLGEWLGWDNLANWLLLARFLTQADERGN